MTVECVLPPGVLEALLQPWQMEALLHVVRSSFSSLPPREEAPRHIRQSRSYLGVSRASRTPALYESIFTSLFPIRIFRAVEVDILG